MEHIYGDDGKNFSEVLQERIRKSRNLFQKLKKNFKDIFEKFFECFWLKKVSYEIILMNFKIFKWNFGEFRGYNERLLQRRW